MQAVREIGFPAAAFFAVMFLGNKWAGSLVQEMRLFRETMERATRSIEAHVTERGEHVISAVTHDVRAALGPWLPETRR